MGLVATEKQKHPKSGVQNINLIAVGVPKTPKIKDFDPLEGVRLGFYSCTFRSVRAPIFKSISNKLSRALCRSF